MRNQTHARTVDVFSGVFVALFVAACGGGSSSGDTAGSNFTLESSSLIDGATWEINRPIEFTFTSDVDFSTVNQNSISVRRVGGAPATGTFTLIDDRTVAFRPACPTKADYSDAGLLPGGVTYEIVIRGENSGSSVRSTTGEPLGVEQTMHLITPASALPTVLFIDGGFGPPRAVIGQPAGSYVEKGADPLNREYFADPADPVTGASTPPSFESALNLYSETASQVAIIVVVNQPVDPSETNVSADNVRLEYDTLTGSPTTWANVPHTVELVANCTESGAVLRITPNGILPQGRRVRVVLGTLFKDIVGNGNVVALAIASFKVGEALDPEPPNDPGDGADEVLEEFVVSGDDPDSLEDADAAFADARAVWSDGKLSAAFAFDGTGGPPNGDFDWEIGTEGAVAVEQAILDTTFTQITNIDNTASTSVVNGRVDIRNLTIWPNGRLVIQGPNPCTILASGTVTIHGKMLVKGNNNRGVSSFNTAQIPELGSAGQAGGGTGGTGSPLTSQSDPQGLAGFGAFAVPNAGGAGGESGYSDGGINSRRPGGGGGGTLGHDALLPTPNPDRCPDQAIIGLDGEPGFNGSIGNENFTNSGALSGPNQQPKGGALGPRPFSDTDAQGDPLDENDFWGTMFTAQGELIRGELSRAWAGAGGGGGGDSVKSLTFPQVPFSVLFNLKGCGGGGGGGSITILALGDIKLVGSGSIDASGGVGGGGENTNGTNRVGGGSGGGSGGHIILQTASKIDLSGVTLDEDGNLYPSSAAGGLYAVGGQGGEGQFGVGGAQANGIPTSPLKDALPPNSYPTTGANPGPCRVLDNVVGDTGTTASAGPVDVVFNCGGDGGPGIIQLHAPAPEDILPPAGGLATIGRCVRPNPIGSTPDNVDDPLAPWDLLLPIFSRFSTAQSKWIPLGTAAVDPNSTTPDPVNFLFDGTDTDGVGVQGAIETDGVGDAAVVRPLPSILTPTTLATEPTLPFITADKRTIVLDRATLTDDIYVRNPALMRRFELRLTQPGLQKSFDVASAELGSGNEVRLTVSGTGTPLTGFGFGATVLVRPRFFRVITDGTPDSLPASSLIVIQFQAAPANQQGSPNTTVGPLGATDWVPDIETVNTHPNVANFRFIRFRVTFDIVADGGQLSFETPIPSLDFLRVPFRF
jgi:hypothetical protein